MPLAQASAKPPTLSGREKHSSAKPEFAWEKFSHIMKELPPLFRRHWREIALNHDRVPLDPNWEQYLQYELAGILHVLTVRYRGALVGYVFMLVHPHLHYASTSWAQTDLYWLDPSMRLGWTGVRMFRHVELRMKALGAKVILANMKLHFEKERGTLRAVFQRLGYVAIEVMWSKYIG